jgi:transposase-like protein
MQPLTNSQAEDALLELVTKWEKKYPLVVNSWQNNWEKALHLF